MLPKANRLNQKKDFDLVFKKGKSLRSGFLLVKVLKNSLPTTRLGFIVSKKVSNKAVVRNKVRRRLGAAVLESLKGSKKSLDIVVVALPGIEKEEFLTIKEVVASLLKN